jgi:thiol-disulfide isomerase/thioredoxin
MTTAARFLARAALALTITLLSQGAASALNFAETNSGPVPDFTFVDAEGAEHSLADFEGKVVVLNLWATWCAPCRKEMPSLDRLQATHGGEDFQVLALSLDRGGIDQITDFYEELGVTNLAIYHDPKASANRALRAPGLPTTVVIDKDGNEVGRVLGDAEWDSAEVVELIEALIAK